MRMDQRGLRGAGRPGLEPGLALPFGVAFGLDPPGRGFGFGFAQPGL